jgi:hypothetical protein
LVAVNHTDRSTRIAAEGPGKVAAARAIIARGVLAAAKKNDTVRLTVEIRESDTAFLFPLPSFPDVCPEPV